MTRPYQVDDLVIFTRQRCRHQGKILAIGLCGVGQNSRDTRRVVIETAVEDLSGKVHRGNVNVPYGAIVGLAETEKSEVQP